MKHVWPVVLFVASAVFAQPSTEPIEGKWWGTGGTPQDSIELGFDIHRNSAGRLVAVVYHPVLNVYGVPVPLAREGEIYNAPSFGFTLKPIGDELELTFDGKYRAKLHRVTSLPSEAPIPDLPKGPSPLWQAKVGGNIYAAVATREGIAYIGTTGGVMNAVNVKDGKFVWTFGAGRPIHGEALVTADAVFFTCDDGGLYKLGRTDGKQIWRVDIGGATVARILPHQRVFDWDYSAPQPVLADGIIYVGSADGSMNAVNASTGERVWRFATEGKIRASALAVNDRLYFGSLDKNVYALVRSTGKLLWKYDSTQQVTSAPALIDGKIIIGNRGVGLLALDPETGALRWTAPMWESWVESTAVQMGDRFYVGSSDLRKVTCYDPKDGRVVWRTDVYGATWGRPLVTQKTIYVGAEGGGPYFIRHVPGLTALDRDTGKIMWRWPYPPDNSFQSGFAADPVLEGTTLVIGAIDGTLYGFPSS